jgi:hypothetical protein
MSRNPRDELLLRQLDSEESDDRKVPANNDRERELIFSFFVDVLGGSAADLGDELHFAPTVMDRPVA